MELGQGAHQSLASGVGEVCGDLLLHGAAFRLDRCLQRAAGVGEPGQAAFRAPGPRGPA
jgi:hypothetical protein